MKCPKCSHRLLQKSHKRVKLRTAILVFSEDGTACVMPCPGCGEEISVPVTLAKSAIPEDPILFISKGRLGAPPKAKRDPTP